MAKYEVIKREILSMIESGQLKPGDKLPVEQELANLFSVSLSTTRKALLDLVNEGVIYRIKKKGTFISNPKETTEESGLKITSFIVPLNKRSDNTLLQFVYGAQKYLSDHGYSMLIEATNDEVEVEDHFIDQAIQNKLSGLIIFPSNPAKNSEHLFKLRSKNIPFVLVDRYAEGFPVNSVICNNFDGAFQITEHLIRLGHQKILFVSYVASNQAEIVRHRGYSQAMRQYGLPQDFPILNYKEEQEIIKKISEENFTALVCSNDYCALEMMRILSDHGISVPTDVSLTGFDGQKSTRYVSPPLTTVIQPCFDIGFAAAKLLISAIENPDLSCKQIVLPIHLDVRNSTAPPKSIIRKGNVTP